MNLGQLKTACYQRLGLLTGSGAAPGTVVASRITQFINDTHREILQDKHFAPYRRLLLTCVSVANTPFMAIPRSVVNIFTLQDRTNNTTLTERDMLWIRSLDPGLRATAANPWVYAKYNAAAAVIIQPSAASALWIASSSAADTVNPVCTISGFRSSGGPFSVTAQPNGLLGQAVPIYTDITSVTKFVLNSNSVLGDISLYQTNLAGARLATIPLGNTSSRYNLLHLYPTPSAVTTYNLDAEVHIDDMSLDTDEPLVPEDFYELLIIGVKKREYELREKMEKLWGATKAEWIEERKKMVNFVSRQSGLPIQTGYDRRFSQLGPWFPPGT